MLIRKLMLAALVSGTMLAGASAQAQSLADTLVAAYRNSNLLDQNRALLRAADEDVAIAVAELRPVVNFVVDAQGSRRSGVPDTNFTLGFNLSADITLIDFGRGQLARSAAEAQVRATRQALIGIEQNVMLDAVAAFMDVRSSTEAVSLQQATVRAITQELNAARERFELGEVTRTDVSLAEARLAGARSSLVAAQGDLAVAREEYKLVTGEYPGQLRPPPVPPRTATDLATAQDIARRTHPRILQTQFEVTAADLNVERVAAQRHGSVTASAGLGQQLGGQQDGLSGSAGVRYARPVFQGGRISALQRQSIARRDAVRASLHQSVSVTLQGVATAWSNIDVVRAQIQANREQVRAAESAFEGTREEARLGARTTLDVLNAETDLLEARTNLLRAQSSEQIATYNLLSAMGLLTVDHLGLGIPTYDPDAYFNAVRNAPIRSPQGEALDRVLQSIGRN